MESKKEITPAQALERLCNSCARRETCSNSARQKLRQWNIAPEDSEHIVQYLLEHRYIDDQRYAEAFVRDKSQLAKWGAAKIKMHLQSKRIESHIIAQVLEQIDGQAALQDLTRMLEKKLRQIKYTTPYEAYSKLLRFGVSRGYAYEQVASITKQVCKAQDTPED